MGVNKNFVVKNGLEVATDVILANATTKNVGIGSTSPEFKLDVRGGIGATDLYLSGIATIPTLGVSGLTTTRDLIVTGISTIETLGVSGLTTTRDLTVTGITTTKDLIVTGISTLGDVKISSGIITHTSSGIVTYYGDGTYLEGTARGLTATIGVSSEGTYIGAGVTQLDFKTTTGTNIQSVEINSTTGIATVTIQPGVSLGLAIALGG